MTTRSFALCFVVTLMGVTSFISAVPASAGGLFGDIANVFVPGLGTAADNVNREIRNRSSDASVYNHTMGAQFPRGEFRAAQQPQSIPQQSMPQQSMPLRSMPLPPQYAMGNQCLTQAGPYYGPFNPVGMNCFADTQYGRLFGTVIQ